MNTMTIKILIFHNVYKIFNAQNLDEKVITKSAKHDWKRFLNENFKCTV